MVIIPYLKEEYRNCIIRIIREYNEGNKIHRASMKQPAKANIVDEAFGD
jgi:hypothetical protein